MDQKILNFFTFLGLNFELIKKYNLELFEDPTFSKSTGIVRVFMKSKSILTVEDLLTIEEKIKACKEYSYKIAIKCSDVTYNLEDVLSYIKYIREHKADLKQNYFSMLEKDEFILDYNSLQIKVDSASKYDIIKEDCNYYLNQLHRYGFEKLNLSINLEETENDIIANQKEFFKKLAIQSVTSREVATVENKTASKPKYRKKAAKMDTPTYSCINDIIHDEQNVVLHGKVFKIDKIKTKTGAIIYSFYITDQTNSIVAKIFSNNSTVSSDLDLIQKNEWVAIKGDITFDSYSRDQVLKIRFIEKIAHEETYKDSAPQKRAELHCHTKMSVMDGVASVEDYFYLANKFGHKAIGFTDHLNVQAYPEIYKYSKKYPEIKVLYGVEFDVIDKDVKYTWNDQHVSLSDAEYVVFDIETTGLSSEFDEIIEFGATKINSHGEVIGKSIDLFIKPEEPVSDFTTKLTGITNKMLETAPSIKEAFVQIRDYCKNAILVAHNADFDMSFLQSWSVKLGYEKMTNPVIDTLALARSLIVKSNNYRLGTVARKVNVEYDEYAAHRADYDANVLAQIFKIFLEDICNNKAIQHHDEIKLIHQDSIYKKMRGTHLNVIAKNQTGLKQLFQLVSASHTKYFYGSPKMFKIALDQYRENLLIGSCCASGEIFEIASNKTYAELVEAMQYYDYVEIQPLTAYRHLYERNKISLARLKDILNKIIKASEETKTILVASSDAHYAFPEDKMIRNIYINTKGLGGRRHPLFDYQSFDSVYPDQHLRSTTEMMQEFMFIDDTELREKIVIDNSLKIVDMVERVQIIKDKLYTPHIDDVDRKLRKLCYANAHKLYGEQLPDIVNERLSYELDNIIKHKFAVIYWIAHKLVSKSLQDGYLVGSRGSVGSSFAATMANITEVNPLKAHYICSQCQHSEFTETNDIKCGYDLLPKKCPSCPGTMIGEGHNIPFETFLGFNADKVPDIDLNFSSEYQNVAHDYIKDLFGEKKVFRAGTISTVATKTAFGYVKGYLETVDKFSTTRRAEIERLALKCEGVKRTTGQHPGGIIVIPNNYDVEDFCPINYPADDDSSSWYTTHFDFHAIHDNVLKLDILGHVDPTALKFLEELTNQDPKLIPKNDADVMLLFRSLDSLKVNSEAINGETTGAIGIPEFGTQFVRSMLAETKPKSFSDLIQISGLSHGTNVWLNNARNLIENKEAELSDLIGCRDDIMVNLINKGMDKKIAFSIMENVRKGKGLTDDEATLMHHHQIPQWYIDSCQKIQYMFPKAHATAYVLMAWRIAWFKLNYPYEYYATYFSTRISVFDVKTIVAGVNLIKDKLNDIITRLDSKSYQIINSVTKKEKDLVTVYELALEMYAREITMHNVDLNLSDANKFTVQILAEQKYIVPPLSSIDGLGSAAAESIIAARQEKAFVSLEDLKNRTKVTKAHIAAFEQLNMLDNLEKEDQISFGF